MGLSASDAGGNVYSNIPSNSFSGECASTYSCSLTMNLAALHLCTLFLPKVALAGAQKSQSLTAAILGTVCSKTRPALESLSAKSALQDKAVQNTEQL